MPMMPSNDLQVKGVVYDIEWFSTNNLDSGRILVAGPKRNWLGVDPSFAVYGCAQSYGLFPQTVVSLSFPANRIGFQLVQDGVMLRSTTASWLPLELDVFPAIPPATLLATMIGSS